MRKLVQEEGYSVTDICYAFEVSRSSYYYNKTKPDEKEEDENTDQDFTEFNWQVLEEIEEVKMSHPFYGYHRVRARVNGEFKVPINHKRVYQLMKEEDLLCDRKGYDATRDGRDEREKP